MTEARELRSPLQSAERKWLRQQSPAASAIADELNMRPLLVECRIGLGAIARRAGRESEARPEFQSALIRAEEMDIKSAVARARGYSAREHVNRLHPCLAVLRCHEFSECTGCAARRQDHDADAIRADLASLSIKGVIPGRSNRRVNIDHDRELYTQRSIEACLGD
jgi:hypothetical protein